MKRANVPTKRTTIAMACSTATTLGAWARPRATMETTSIQTPTAEHPTTEPQAGMKPAGAPQAVRPAGVRRVVMVRAEKAAMAAVPVQQPVEGKPEAVEPQKEAAKRIRMDHCPVVKMMMTAMMTGSVPAMPATPAFACRHAAPTKTVRRIGAAIRKP